LRSPSFPSGRIASAGDYIVVLKDGVQAGAVRDAGAASSARRAVRAAARRHRAAPSFVYAHALRGYAATLNDAALARAQADPRVAFVAEDREFSYHPSKKKDERFPLPDQIRPFGVQRIGALLSPTAKIDKVDERVDADIASLDTGVQSDHPDLNVVGGVDCQKKGDGTFHDIDGHGTHVAGTAAALDNAIGVVGVAPGARIWGVKVLNDKGMGLLSQIVCGVEWVTANAVTIEVANMSLGDRGEDDGNCGMTNEDALHAAICGSVAAGITYTVSAGNDVADAAGKVPASYDEVIAVSAIADANGQPGGGGSFKDFCLQEVDDTFAFFSNFGSDVDIAANGVCVSSTAPGSLYANYDGTSMASPHAAGAAALYKATHPAASPADVKAALIAAWEPGPIPEDPDTFPEGVVNVSTF
jgi:subtilisin family serine protease